MVRSGMVLLPYKITLLSNIQLYLSEFCEVLLPYKITLLSNGRGCFACCRYVLLPYKITLLSNYQWFVEDSQQVLLPYKITLLSNYSRLETQPSDSFTTIQNYTTLKRDIVFKDKPTGFTTIQNYTTLKRVNSHCQLAYRFYYHTKLHYSQTT